MNTCYFCGQLLDHAEYDGKPNWHEECRLKAIQAVIAAQPSANPNLADYWAQSIGITCSAVGACNPPTNYYCAECGAKL